MARNKSFISEMINHWAKEMFLSLNVGIGVVCARARKLALQYANVYQTLD